MIKYFSIINNLGLNRLIKPYTSTAPSQEYFKRLFGLIYLRSIKSAPIFEFEGLTIVYRKFGNLYWILGLDSEENEFECLELINFIVETLNKYFENLSELDIINELEKVNEIIDDIILKGRIVETNSIRALAYSVQFNQNLD